MSVTIDEERRNHFLWGATYKIL
ncbi:hypothetical protein VTO73DRAFT_5258 [Trametes versicolor]